MKSRSVNVRAITYTNFKTQFVMANTGRSLRMFEQQRTVIEVLYLEKLCVNPADGHSLVLGIQALLVPSGTLIGGSGYRVLTVILLKCR